jgi:RNA polymerase sigma factor (sigma-70 family)
MSTKWLPQANDEPFEALQALFLRIAEGESGLIESDDIWRQVVRDPWFRAEVRIQAARLLGHGVEDPLCDDLAQQAVVQFRAKLSKRNDLGADIEQLRTNFPGWMASIIRNACIDTLRRERRHPHEVVTESSAFKDPIPQEDLRLDMAEAIAQLEQRERGVARCKLHEMTVEEMAEALELSDRQVEGSAKKVVKLLKRLLALYRYDK